MAIPWRAGQAAGHEVAEVTTGDFAVRAQALEPLVGRGQVLARHPDTGVDDDDYVATFQETAIYVHGCGRWREAEGVFDQLSQDVDEVGRHDARYHGGVEMVQPQAFVVLDFGRGGASHVHDRHRGAPLAGRPAAGQDEERFGVASHTSGQVVEAEQLLERSGVGFLQLDLGDVLELPGDEVLVAPAEVHKCVGQVAPESRLAGGQLDGRFVERIEGGGHAGHLFDISRANFGQLR